MKQVLFIIALIGATATSSFAQINEGKWPAPPTAAEVQVGKQKLIAKTNQFEASLRKNNATKSNDLAWEVINLMRDRVHETRLAEEALSDKAAREAMDQRMLMLERRVKSFMTGAKDIKANGADLVSQAHVFSADYE